MPLATEQVCRILTGLSYRGLVIESQLFGRTTYKYSFILDRNFIKIIGPEGYRKRPLVTKVYIHPDPERVGTLLQLKIGIKSNQLYIFCAFMGMYTCGAILFFSLSAPSDFAIILPLVLFQLLFIYSVFLWSFHYEIEQLLDLLLQVLKPQNET